jgi:hypothetical protein
MAGALGRGAAEGEGREARPATSDWSLRSSWPSHGGQGKGLVMARARVVLLGPIEIAAGATFTPPDDAAIDVGNWRSATIVVDVLKNPNTANSATVSIQTATTTPLGPWQYTDPTKRFNNTATSGTTIAITGAALGAQIPITVTNLADQLRAAVTANNFSTGAIQILVTAYLSDVA